VSVFRFSQAVLFKHCDPAGIVFFPRYFEMINDCAEAFFAHALDYPFHRMHPDFAVPTVSIDTEFPAPSRHGDRLDLSLSVVASGRASVTLNTVAECGGQVRFRTHAVLVHVDGKVRPAAWPAAVRARIGALVEDGQ